MFTILLESSKPMNILCGSMNLHHNIRFEVREKKNKLESKSRNARTFFFMRLHPFCTQTTFELRNRRDKCQCRVRVNMSNRLHVEVNEQCIRVRCNRQNDNTFYIIRNEEKTLLLTNCIAVGFFNTFDLILIRIVMRMLSCVEHNIYILFHPFVYWFEIRFKIKRRV